MKRYFVKHDSTSWRWKELTNMGWSFFDDRVTDKQSMLNYFTESGRCDSVELSFVDDGLRPAKIFEVKRQYGKTVAIMNGGEKQIPLSTFEFIPQSESIKFFQDRSLDEVNLKSDALLRKDDQFRSEFKILKYYKSVTDQNTLNDYKEMLSERMNDSAIRENLKKWYPEKQSEAYFLK